MFCRMPTTTALHFTSLPDTAPVHVALSLLLNKNLPGIPIVDQNQNNHHRNQLSSCSINFFENYHDIRQRNAVDFDVTLDADAVLDDGDGDNDGGGKLKLKSEGNSLKSSTLLTPVIKVLLPSSLLHYMNCEPWFKSLQALTQYQENSLGNLNDALSEERIPYWQLENQLLNESIKLFWEKPIREILNLSGNPSNQPLLVIEEHQLKSSPHLIEALLPSDCRCFLLKEEGNQNHPPVLGIFQSNGYFKSTLYSMLRR